MAAALGRDRSVGSQKHCEHVAGCWSCDREAREDCGDDFGLSSR